MTQLHLKVAIYVARMQPFISFPTQLEQLKSHIGLKLQKTHLLGFHDSSLQFEPTVLNLVPKLQQPWIPSLPWGNWHFGGMFPTA